MIGKLKYLSGSLTAGSARVIQMVTTLILMPLMVKALGTQQFAIFMAATSLMGAMAFLDLGIGASLVNQLASTSHTKLGQSERQSVTNAILLLSMVAGLLALVVTLAHFGITMLGPQRVSTDAGREEALFIACLLLAVMPPFLLIPGMRLALSEIPIHSLWDVTGSLLVFGAIWIIVRCASHPLIPSVLACFITPSIMFSLNGLSLFRRHPVLIPTIKLIDWDETKRLLSSGSSFFLLTVLLTASFSFNSVLALYLLDGSSTAEFALAQRMALGMQTLTFVSLMPFWPQFHAAVEKGDRSRTIKIILTAFGLALTCSLPTALLVIFFGGTIAQIWTRGMITLSPAVCTGLAAWLVTFSLAAVIAALMNIPRLVRLQLKLMFGCVFICFVGKIVLAQLWGPSGLFWGNILGFSLMILVPGAVVLFQHFLAPENGAKMGVDNSRTTRKRLSSSGGSSIAARTSGDIHQCPHHCR